MKFILLITMILVSGLTFSQSTPSKSEIKRRVLYILGDDISGNCTLKRVKVTSVVRRGDAIYGHGTIKYSCPAYFFGNDDKYKVPFRVEITQEYAKSESTVKDFIGAFIIGEQEMIRVYYETRSGIEWCEGDCNQ